MDVWTALVLVSLTSYRAWRLLTYDTLPPLVDRREQLEDAVARRWGNGWADGIACPWCSGTWAAIIVTVCVDVTVGMPLPVLVGAAAATAVGLIGSYDLGG